ncbi:uncharacterized protein LOC136074684 [Hydra vulgaris]|uniref:Uncharacterized protein LOC136074684 n=1 Tax=Hydra vulgaris TaxID=6087 RepID=A0ABM4B2S8_HYDVU
MIFTTENKHDFNAATECNICRGKLGKDKVRDHCHITRKYRVPYHNLSGYDSHSFIKKLSGGKLSCIPSNEEKYISFSREIKVDEYIKEGKKLDLLLRKGVYPYDWVDSINRFNETQLPPKILFFSKLNDEDIRDDDHSHVQNVWNEFNCKTFKDYHNLYNVSDVLLLAHVFENFRDVCMNCYKLDPAWYYTSPGLAWDAALNKTKLKLELLSDYDMILMIKKGIRGGISMISNRLGTSNNKYMGNEYDQSKPSTFIQYLDANNLYGWAMNYPEYLHDKHNDYPLAPERINIDKLGLKNPKIHRGIKFEERAWLNEYIELNTNLRIKATNDFEIDFFKLMNNSVFGKTMENAENRVDIRLVTDRNEVIKLASKPNFESTTIFNENLIAIHIKRKKLKYAKPIYLGMCILGVSKPLMYKFHYDYIKKKYSDQAKLLLIDTDSLAYDIKTEDFFSDISKDIESKFDTSLTQST